MVTSPVAPADARRVHGPDQDAQAAVAHAPSDVLRLLVALVLLVVALVVGVVWGDAVVTFAAKLLRGHDALPTWLFAGAAGVAQVAAVALVLLGIVATARARSWRLLLAVVVASTVGALVTAGAVHLVASHASRVTDAAPFGATGHGSRWTAAGLGAMTAGVATVCPWVSRRWRWVAWAVVTGVAIAVFVTDPVSFNTVLALLAGWAVGTAVTVVAGSPSHRPTAAAISTGLADVGVPVATIEPADLDARGSTVYFGRTRDGTRLFVKALGRDERSADLLFRLYRRAQPHDLGDEKSFSTLRRAVEHEALVSLAVRDLGVRTPRLVALATAEPDGFVLAYEAVDGRSLDRVAAAELTDDVLAATWRQLALLRRHRVAHRDLRLANLFLDDQAGVWLIDFGFAELAASDVLLATDVAELLASSASAMGPDRAVAAAVRELGGPAVRSGLERLRLPLLSGATRTAMKAQPATMDGLRRHVAALAA
jgi:undecaprenyl-diphosphatase